MATALACPACHALLDAPTDYVGDEIPCPQCAAPVPLPATLIPLTAVVEAAGPKPTALRLWSPGEELRRVKEERLFAMLTHALPLAAYFLVGLVFGFVPPLVVLVLKGKDSAFVTHHAKESLNYQIMLAFLSFLFGSTFGVLLVVGVVLGFTIESKPMLIGYFALLSGAGLISLFLQLFSLLMVTLASIKSYHGEWFRYPFCVRFVK